jgi:hypothetical protein
MFSLVKSVWGGRPRATRVVYTCLFGYFENFNNFIYERDPSIDYVCFTDMPELRSEFWRIERVSRGDLDPARAAKQHKILPHRFLQRYDASLYMDNVVRLKVPAAKIFDRYLDPSPSPFVCFRHHERECIYDEGHKVISLGLDKPEHVNAQLQEYRAMGYPAGNGLWKGGFLLRRHHDPAVAAMMETWFEQVRSHSYRDQLSLPVAAWLHRFTPGIIDLDFTNNDLVEWPCPRVPLRVPRGFDDRLYLDLNPDVRVKRVDPRKHYLLYGAAEGRRYK